MSQGIPCPIFALKMNFSSPSLKLNDYLGNCVQSELKVKVAATAQLEFARSEFRRIRLII